MNVSEHLYAVTVRSNGKVVDSELIDVHPVGWQRQEVTFENVLMAKALVIVRADSEQEAFTQAGERAKGIAAAGTWGQPQGEMMP
jgi:hypothetical protein